MAVRLVLAGFGLAAATAGGDAAASCTAGAGTRGCARKEAAGIIFLQTRVADSRLVRDVCQVGEKVPCPGSAIKCGGDECCPGESGSFPCPSATPGWGQGFCDRGAKVTDCLEEQGSCNVGDNVKCPGDSGAYCMGKECCPGSGGTTFPCPSAPEGWGAGYCTRSFKEEDCLEGGSAPHSMEPSPTPAPAATRPHRPPRAHGPLSLTIDIFNKEWSDGVIFCRGPPGTSLDGVFLDEALTRNVVGSEVDCSSAESPAAQKWGHGVPLSTTLALALRRGEWISLYIAPEGSWISGTCWYQDTASNKRQSLAMGPKFQSQTEFTISAGTNQVVSYDLTSVEGVSGGLTMNYTDADLREVIVVAKPGPFKGNTLQVVSAPEGLGFPTVLSDKWRTGGCNCSEFSPNSEECNTDGCYAACPSSLANNPCGEHRCRQYYEVLYQTEESYCGWLYSEQAQTYCWAMDEWRCTDTTCGYGGANQPPEDCSAPYPAGAAPHANSYSCGRDINLVSGTPGQSWWPDSVGCVDKLVGGVPTNPMVPRLGGTISMSFESLAWLHL